MKTINLQTCKVFSEMMQEDNDCAVKALAITLQIDYITAHAHLRRVGRKSNKGVNGLMILNALTRASGKVYAFNDIQPTRGEFGRHVTPRTFATLKPKGHYICITRGHAIPVVDGVVEDWTANRNHRIMAFIEVDTND